MRLKINVNEDTRSMVMFFIGINEVCSILLAFDSNFASMNTENLMPTFNQSKIVVVLEKVWSFK
jgi:hypothetical protein